MIIDQKLKNLIENNAMSLATVDDKKPYVIGVAFVKVVRMKNQKAPYW
ncbi:MAG: hypothetical protein QW404_02920 [Candidatus Nanoarchaeia archaeon]